MPLSKESRTLGQHAAGLSAAALLLASLDHEDGIGDAVAFLILTGTNNAAVLTGLAGMFVTVYFLARVWDEHLAMNADQLLMEHGSRARPSEALPDHLGEDLAANMRLQGVIKQSIGLIDFWGPLALAALVALSLWQRIFTFFAEMLLTFR